MDQKVNNEGDPSSVSNPTSRRSRRKRGGGSRNNPPQDSLAPTQCNSASGNSVLPTKKKDEFNRNRADRSPQPLLRPQSFHQWRSSKAAVNTESNDPPKREEGNQLKPYHKEKNQHLGAPFKTDKNVPLKRDGVSNFKGQTKPKPSNHGNDTQIPKFSTRNKMKNQVPGPPVTRDGRVPIGMPQSLSGSGIPDVVSSDLKKWRFQPMEGGPPNTNRIQTNTPQQMKPIRILANPRADALRAALSTDKNPRNRENDERTKRRVEQIIRQKQRLDSLARWKAGAVNYVVDLFQKYGQLALVLDAHCIELLFNDESSLFTCSCCSRKFMKLSKVQTHIKTIFHLENLERSRQLLTARSLSPDVTFYADFTVHLENFISSKTMTSSNTDLRNFICDQLNTLADSLNIGCKVVISGSTYSGLGMFDSDLNLNLVVKPPHLPPDTMMLFSKRVENMSEVLKHKEFFSQERPHFKFCWKNAPFKCKVELFSQESMDLAVLLNMYSSFDPRVKKLCHVFRSWAKICQLDREENETWPPYVMYIMVIYFLQHLRQPILPIFDDYICNEIQDVPKDQETWGRRLIHEYIDFLPKVRIRWKTENTAALGELWVDFLAFWGLEFDNTAKVVCITQQDLAPKSLGGRKRHRNSHKFLVIDPFIPRARAVKCFKSHEVYEYYHQCLLTTYIYYCVPQYDTGPLFHFIRHDTKLSPEVAMGVASVSELNFLNSAVTSQIFKLLTRIDPRYGIYPENENKETLVRSIAEMLKSNNYVNVCGLPLNDISLHLSNGLPYVSPPSFTPFKTDALVLVARAGPYNRIVEFDLKSFTKKKSVPVKCAICCKKNHLQSHCPTVKLPQLRPFPAIGVEVYNDVNLVIANICEKNMLTLEQENSRLKIVSELEENVKQFYPTAQLTLFGSSCNGFGSKKSDLDVCLRFSDDLNGDKVPSHLISKLTGQLRKSKDLKKVMCIPTAKVPIVKFVHGASGLDGDLSLYNSLALENTKLLSCYCQIDSRLKELGHMVKYLAKMCDICNASKGSLSSYGYILLTIYFLQQCEPPVLPVLQERDPQYGGPFQVKIVDDHVVSFYDDVSVVCSRWPRNNTRTCGELWIEFLRFYTEIFDFENHVVSIRRKKILTKFDKFWFTRCLAIEDPFDLDHNLGRNLSRKMNYYIVKTFRNARWHFASSYTAAESKKKIIDYYFDKSLLNGRDGSECSVCNNPGHRKANCPQKPRDTEQ